jgi:uncharacterized protein (DUF58 family)
LSPTPRAAVALGAIALAALFVPVWIVVLAALALATATVVDALAARKAPAVDREVPRFLHRGLPAGLILSLRERVAGRARLRQPVPPDLRVQPSEADGELAAELVARRRGHHSLPRPALRLEGPLGLGCWYHRAGEESDVVVYPDLPNAFRIALAVRRGRFREAGHRSRGPLGLGTDFESIRDYLPDDDIRQVNWRATARLGRPMSNQYRIEQDRDVICVVDMGRLMGAPLAERTRLDAAVDAVSAVAAVADEVGDRCGAVAFDAKIQRNVRPRRKGARAVVRAVYDLEPTRVDSDYELAFHTVRNVKRAFVLVLTDLLEEEAARPLVDAVPLLSRRHAVVVASAADTDLEEIVRREPRAELDVYSTAVALDVLDARASVTAELRRAGAEVIEAPPDRLAAACVGSYLRAKARARL